MNVSNRLLTAHTVLREVGLFVLSVVVALLLVRTDAFRGLITAAAEWRWLGSFVAGLLFTSIFTTAPAVVTLGEIALTSPLWLVALFGACGAVVGDAILLRVLRGHVVEDFLHLLSSRGVRHRLKLIGRLRAGRWLLGFLGALTIASPLPDELGLLLLRLAHVRLRTFVALSFTLNFLGILIVGAVARAV